MKAVQQPTTVDRPRPGRMSEIGEESRQRLMDAAEALFAEKGFVETSFVDIARRAGISRGSIPWHFENKVGLLLAIVERTVERLNVDDALRDGHRGLDDLVGLSSKLMRSSSAAFISTALVEATKPGSVIRESYKKIHQRARDAIADWLRRSGGEVGLPRGVTRESMAAVVVGLAIGLHQQWRVAPEAVDLEAYLRAMKAVLDDALSVRAAKIPRAPTPTRSSKRAATNARRFRPRGR